MKNYAIISLTLATALFAVSCQKENDPVAKSEHSPAAIKAEINAINTSAIDDKYEILWEENAKLYLTDGTNSGTYTLSAGKGSASGTFNRDTEVKYSGSAQAYYPETLVGDGAFIWPAVQTMDQAVPLYGSINLTGAEPENMKLTSMGAVLQILYVSTKDNIVLNSIRIQDAEKTLSGTFEVNGYGQAVITSTDGSGIILDLGQDGVTVGKEVQKFYVAVPAGEYNNLSVIFSTSDGEQVLRNRKLNARTNTVCSLSLNSSLSAAKESVQLWAGGPYWATTNIGAVTPESIGLFYAWGFYYKGQGCGYAGGIWYGSKGFLSNRYSFEVYYESGGFLDFGNTFDDYKTHQYEDIAKLHWSEQWRLPTKEEFQGLLDNCTLESTTIGGVKGWRFTGKGEYSGNSIFFPATGRGYAKDWLHKEDSGYYWSSTANSDENAYVFQWYDNGQPAMNFIPKYYGCVVRPVTDDGSKPVLPEAVLPGNFSINADHSVHFTKGNLFYDYKDEVFHFEENQYDYPAEWDIYHVGHFFWSDKESEAYAKSNNDQSTTSSQVFFTNSELTKPRADFTVDGIAGKYRALLKSEWNYILNGRPNASSLKKTGVTVCDKKNCLILAPDNFKGTIQSSYDAQGWLKAESEGLVCLPAGGLRIGVNTMLGETGGYYWTFDWICVDVMWGYMAAKPENLYSRSNDASIVSGKPSFGYSVRLVYAVD